MSANKHDFPIFSAEYRDRWRSAGLWTDDTLHGGFDEIVAAYPDKIALISADATYTFAQFKAESDALAAGLIGAGIGTGDIVAVQLPNWVEFCFLQIALSRIGAVIQPLHMAFREREMRNLCEFCETDVAVVCDIFQDYDYAGLMRKLMPGLPNLRKMIVTRGAAGGADEHVLAELVAEGRDNLERLESVNVSPDDVFYLNFTSGTEGDPKGFLHTHNTLIPLMKITAAMQASANPDRVSLACSPMTHSYGHFSTYNCAMGGTSMVLVDRYNPTRILELIQSARVTAMSGTPAHLIGILDHPDFDKYDTSCVGAVGVGGARSAPELIARLERTWGVKTGNTYGMGENIVHTMTLPNDPEDKVRETVGRPVPGVELKIVDTGDRAREAATGVVGEIVFRGPTLFVGYHRQPELTASTRDDEGWFYTSDLGFVDEDGYLHYAGRAKEVINRGGTKIYPKEIEDLLNTHPRVLDAAVVGWPDERMGERVCAYIVPAQGKDLSLEEVAAHLNDQAVTKYMIPEFVINLSEFPMTPTGKVRKASLQEDAAQRARDTG